jgi:elongation factor P
MQKIGDLRKNNVVRLGGQVYKIREISSKTPSARASNTLVKLVLENVRTRQRVEQSMRSDDALEEVQLERKTVQYLYREGDRFVFMDLADYSQTGLDEDTVGDQSVWLADGMEDIALFTLDGEPLGVSLPAFVELEVAEAAAVPRGATATAQTKPARLSNGVEIQVPEYISPGDRVRVSTETGRFMARV